MRKHPKEFDRYRLQIMASAVLMLGTGCAVEDDEAIPTEMYQRDSGASKSNRDFSYASADAGMAPPSKDPGPTEPGLSAGTLTAGSFDDHFFPGVFDEFLDQMAQSNPPARVEQRVLIEVTDRDGLPVTDARVKIRDAKQTLAELVTGSDGRTLFLPEIDGGAGAASLILAAEKDGVMATQQVDPANGPWQVILDAELGRLPEKLEIAFVVDATGSMSDELEFLKVETEDIVAQVAAANGNLEIRFALIVYRDEGDDYVTREFDFAGLTAFRQQLVAQSANGGGDYPEAMDAALLKASQLSWSVDNRARMLFLIADAPPHAEAMAQSLDLMDSFRRKGVRVYPIAASGVAEEAEYVMRVGAFKTLARYIFLTNDSGYGNSHADPNIPPHTPTQTNEVPCYNIEKLNSLIVRMISSELVGHALPPDPQQVLRSVGTPTDGICDPTEAGI